MKRTVMALFVVLLGVMCINTGAGVADLLDGLKSKSCPSASPDPSMPSSQGTVVDATAFPSCQDPAITIEAKSGCCSHHGGVCGCDSNTGHALCCDGKDSPSCGC